MFEYNESDLNKVISGYFLSVDPLKLREFPGKQKRKYIALTLIVKKFALDRIYNESEVNDILSEIYMDFAGLRRALVDYKFMGRKNDCSEYWVIKK